MLLILYGATAGMEYESKKYLVESGFDLIEKYNYAPAEPELVKYYGSRKFVDEDTFYENTDSLFHYEVAGVCYGFNHLQISDAVCNKKNALLALSAPNIEFLAEIKRVYAENVCLIYAYIDETTSTEIARNLPNIREEEVKKRLKIGKHLRQNYANNPALFDKVVIYGGENSVFDTANLIRQYQSIIRPMISAPVKKEKYADIFISCASGDRKIWKAIDTELSIRGLSAFSPENEQRIACKNGSDKYRDGNAGNSGNCVSDRMVGLHESESGGDRIFDAIRYAKVVVPVVTEKTLSSVFVEEELKAALDAAENNGALIIPLFAGNIEEKREHPLYSRLTAIAGITVEGEQIGEAAVALAENIKKILSAESNLKELSGSVENYLCLKMYRQAAELQKAHMKLCDEVYRISNGASMDLEACLLSRVKLASILLDMGRPEEALEYVIEALNSGEEDTQTFELLAEQFALCCVRCGMGEEAVKSLIEKRLPGAHGWDRVHECGQNDLVERFVAEKQNMYEEKTTGEQEVKDVDEKQIAQYGELAMSLFDELLEKEKASVSSYDLITGYERILNYCKHMGLRGEIADKCINRIAELKNGQESPQNPSVSDYSEALRIYLGKALPKSGEYDVFLSYKSEDEVLAQKVYDYLVQTGKEVFFAKETLPQLGDSEYEEMIFDAIDKSRHMILIGSNPEYLKTAWVKDEWSTFNNEIREGRKTGNLLLLLSDDISGNKGSLPAQLRQKEIVKMSEFRGRLLSYLR